MEIFLVVKKKNELIRIIFNLHYMNLTCQFLLFVARTSRFDMWVSTLCSDWWKKDSSLWPLTLVKLKNARSFSWSWRSKNRWVSSRRGGIVHWWRELESTSIYVCTFFTFKKFGLRHVDLIWDVTKIWFDLIWNSNWVLTSEFLLQLKIWFTFFQFWVGM